MGSAFFDKIIWAVDPLESTEPSTGSKFLVGALSRISKAKIEPMFVLTPPYANFSESPTEIEEAFRALAEKRMANLSKISDLENLSAGKVLVNHSGSMRKAVQTFIDHAMTEHADAIVVDTHARKGVSRLFMGSFAETLALYSPVPIFSVNPQTKVREKISKIIFPTDFAPQFRNSFETVVKFAKAVEAQLTLFYKAPVIPAPYKSEVIYQFLAQEAVRRAQDAAEWQGWAVHEGVKTDLHLDNQPGFLATALEEFTAEKNFDLIAMATQADAVSAVLVGSLTRQMIRHAPCPVWTLRVNPEDEYL